MSEVGWIWYVVAAWVVGGVMGARIMHLWWERYYVERLEAWKGQLDRITEQVEKKNQILKTIPKVLEPGEKFVVVKANWAEWN